jgi:hypothetical protein
MSRKRNQARMSEKIIFALNLRAIPLSTADSLYFLRFDAHSLSKDQTITASLPAGPSFISVLRISNLGVNNGFGSTSLVAAEIDLPPVQLTPNLPGRSSFSNSALDGKARVEDVLRTAI